MYTVNNLRNAHSQINASYLISAPPPPPPPPLRYEVCLRRLPLINAPCLIDAPFPLPKIVSMQSRHNLVPRACVPPGQRSETSTALDESKTGTRKSWFWFDCARAPKVVMKRTSFQQPIRFGRLCDGLSD